MKVPNLELLLQGHAVVVTARDEIFCCNCAAALNGMMSSKSCPGCKIRFSFMISSDLGLVDEAGDKLVKQARKDRHSDLKGLSYIGRDKDGSRRLEHFYKVLAHTPFKSTRRLAQQAGSNELATPPPPRTGPLVPFETHVALAHTLVLGDEEMSWCGRCGRERQADELVCGRCIMSWSLLAGDSEAPSLNLESMLHATTDGQPLQGMSFIGAAAALPDTFTDVAWRLDHSSIYPYWRHACRARFATC